jgi:hypothetical protein
MGLLIFPDLHANWLPDSRNRQKHGVFPSIEMLDAFRYGKINTHFGLVDFSKTYTRMGCPIQENRAKTRRFPSIEMLDAFRYGKIHPHFAAC